MRTHTKKRLYSSHEKIWPVLTSLRIGRKRRPFEKSRFLVASYWPFAISRTYLWWRRRRRRTEVEMEERYVVWTMSVSWCAVCTRYMCAVGTVCHDLALVPGKGNRIIFFLRSSPNLSCALHWGVERVSCDFLFSFPLLESYQAVSLSDEPVLSA